MSDLDALIHSLLSGQDVTNIGQEYRSRTRMIMVDPGYAGSPEGWTEIKLSKSQEVAMSLRAERYRPDPDKAARVSAAIEAAAEKLAENGFPNWPTLCRGYE